MLPTPQLNPGWPSAQALPRRTRPGVARTRVTPKSLSVLFLAGYVFFLPLQIPLKGVNFAPSDIFLLLWLLVEMGRLRIRREAWSAWHIVFVATFWLGTWISVLNHGGFTTYMIVKNAGLAAVFLGYFFVTSSVRSWDDIRLILRVFIFAVALHCCIALAGYFLKVRSIYLNYSPDPYSTAAERVSGMLLDPNAFGGLVMVALVLQCFTFTSERPLWKGIPGIVIALLLAFALLLTLSRSAWIALGFALFTLGLFRPKLVLLYGAVAFIGTAGAYIASGRKGTHVAAVADRPRTTQQRLDQIREAWPLITQNPIMGTGLGGFDDAEKSNPSVGHPYIIHNTTVWIVTEFGLVGVTTFLGMLLWVVRAGRAVMRRASNAQAWLIIALLSAHVGMFGLSTGIEGFYQRHWWMVMALVASAYALHQTHGSPTAELEEAVR